MVLFYGNHHVIRWMFSKQKIAANNQRIATIHSDGLQRERQETTLMIKKSDVRVLSQVFCLSLWPENNTKAEIIEKET